MSFTPPWMLMYFSAGVFWISPCVWPNSGFSPCLFLTLRISLVACISYPVFGIFLSVPGSLAALWGHYAAINISTFNVQFCL
jgi:hypothetical protein